MPDEVPEPLTPLAERAARLHEFYSELVKAGFSREEAMEILIESVRDERD